MRCRSRTPSFQLHPPRVGGAGNFILGLVYRMGHGSGLITPDSWPPGSWARIRGIKSIYARERILDAHGTAKRFYDIRSADTKLNKGSFIKQLLSTAARV